jgi:hypothetical protein
VICVGRRATHQIASRFVFVRAKKPCEAVFDQKFLPSRFCQEESCAAKKPKISVWSTAKTSGQTRLHTASLLAQKQICLRFDVLLFSPHTSHTSFDSPSSSLLPPTFVLRSPRICALSFHFLTFSIQFGAEKTRDRPFPLNIHTSHTTHISFSPSSSPL